MGRPTINEIGNRYGKLLVIGYKGKNQQGDSLWECSCDCGNTKIARGGKLREGSPKSCGCEFYPPRKLGINSKDEKGNVYGLLTVIDRAENEKTYKDGKIVKSESMWVCVCVCGQKVKIRGRSLRWGDVKSCGCGGQTNEDVAFNSLYIRMKSSAESRGYKWKLDKEFVRNITSKNCHYCGTVPSQVSKSSSKKGIYLYNGIDRVNNLKGYIQNNVVPCCKTCNSAKNTKTLSDFKEWINRVYHNLSTF